VSHRLTAYPDDLLQRPLDERSARVTVAPGGESTSVSGGDPWSSRALGDPGPPAVDPRDLTVPVAILGLAVAAISGAGHALTPGHGKTLMSAYLIGTRGRPRDALLLALAVTVSHTAGVLVLAGVVLVAGSALPADRLYPVLSAISGAIVIGIGAWLLLSCLRRRRSAMAHHHSHDHAHPHSHPHSHGEADQVGTGRGGLVAIGLAGGMIPSTAALVLLLGAIAAGQPGYGVALAVAFGLGMAAVLVALGLLIVRGRSRMIAVAARLPGLVRLAPAVPWAAAIVVLAGGVALTGTAVVAVI
ncbi:MAG: sulfite exporter TauE/SafE family protein, partial [Candidatus Limnocylindria bacterium]